MSHACNVWEPNTILILIQLHWLQLLEDMIREGRSKDGANVWMAFSTVVAVGMYVYKQAEFQDYSQGTDAAN